MRDNPRKNLKWLEQELLAEEDVFRDFSQSDNNEYDSDNLWEQMDQLLTEEESPVPDCIHNHNRKTRAERLQQKRVPKFDEAASVSVKTRRQLRQDKKHARAEAKKAGINKNIKGLVFLAILECIGILAIIGWWLQWLI